MRFDVCKRDVSFKEVNELFVSKKRNYFIKLEFSVPVNIEFCGLEFKRITFIDLYSLENAILGQTSNPNICIKLIKSPVDDLPFVGLIGETEKFITGEVDPNTRVTYTYIRDNKSKGNSTDDEHILSKENSREIRDKKTKDAKSIWINSQSELACKIWDQVREYCQSKEFQDLEDSQKLKYFQSQYPKFNRQHPVVLRYMVTGAQFSKVAFEKYLTKVVDTPMNSRDAQIENQSNYVVLLWKNLTPHYDAEKARKLKERTFAELKKETKLFREMEELAEELDDEIQKSAVSEIKLKLEDRINLIREEYKQTGEIILPGYKSDESSGDEDNIATKDTFKI